MPRSHRDVVVEIAPLDVSFASSAGERLEERSPGTQANIAVEAALLKLQQADPKALSHLQRQLEVEFSNSAPMPRPNAQQEGGKLADEEQPKTAHDSQHPAKGGRAGSKPMHPERRRRHSPELDEAGAGRSAGAQATDHVLQCTQPPELNALVYTPEKSSAAAAAALDAFESPAEAEASPGEARRGRAWRRRNLRASLPNGRSDAEGAETGVWVSVRDSDGHVLESARPLDDPSFSAVHAELRAMGLDAASAAVMYRINGGLAGTPEKEQWKDLLCDADIAKAIVRPTSSPRSVGQ
jgi:hypothetical protein